MSFSSVTKNELCHRENSAKCCNKAELAGIIHTAGAIRIEGRNNLTLRIMSENASITRRFFKCIKDLYNTNANIFVRKNKRLRKNNCYILQVESGQVSENILRNTYILCRDSNLNNSISYNIDKNLIENDCCKKAYLRGAFLGGGSVSDPEKTYHLEVVAHNDIYAKDLSDLIKYFNLNAKIVERKNNFVVYLKEGEDIVDFLNIVGAHNALLKFENVRIYKGMRNNVNRIVNCETANLNKTIDAAIRQIDNIEYIDARMGLRKLPKSLREIAEARINNPDASLRELGQSLERPIGKSGVNHRLRKLDIIAEKLKTEKGGDI